MHIVRLDDALKFFIFAANLLKVLRIESLFGEVYENTPTPVLLFHWVVQICLYLDSNETTRYKEWNNVFRLTHDLSDRSANLFTLDDKLLLLSDEFLLRNGAKLLILFDSLGQLGFDLWQDSFILELVETLHDNVLRHDILDSHHIEQHVVA